MLDADEHQLVVSSLRQGLGGAVEWRNDRVIRDISRNRDLQGWTASAIKAELINFVRLGGLVQQVLEKRPEWRDQYRFYYKAILPIDSFQYGLFVEIVLEDDDGDYPSVLLVNAHPQRR